jgi:hypothetical protein
VSFRVISVPGETDALLLVDDGPGNKIYIMGLFLALGFSIQAKDIV